MKGFISLIVRNFEHTHGIHPNLLYINPVHSEYLKAGYTSDVTMMEIMDELQMELIIDRDATHPHVAWTSGGQR